MARRRSRGRGSPGRGVAQAALLVSTLALPAVAVAQAPAGPGWDEEVGYAAANALLGGLVAGLFRSVSDDGSFGDAFWTGVAGGATTYVGKRVTAKRFDGAGVLGRQIASVGGSMVANARDGRGAFDRLTLQLGLGRLYWDRTESSVLFRPDVATIVYAARAAASERLEVDWSHTFSAGTPAFVTRRGLTTLDDDAAGRALAGVILIDRNARVPTSLIAAHERTHVLQYDQQFALWAEPAERGLASLLGSGVAGVVGRVDLSVGLLPFAPFLGRVPRDLNPFEAEADHLTALGGSFRE